LANNTNSDANVDLSVSSRTKRELGARTFAAPGVSHVIHPIMGGDVQSSDRAGLESGVWGDSYLSSTSGKAKQLCSLGNLGASILKLLLLLLSILLALTVNYGQKRYVSTRRPS
jgi:hypothetical protein